MPLSSVYHSGPVTALCCHKDFILAGVGSHLHVYTVLPSIKHVQILDVLPGRNVHGIVPELSEACQRICVYGQKSIRLVELDAEHACVKLLGDLLEFSDWIWDVTWLQDGNALCLALGHNVVVTFDLRSGSITQTAHCEEKCILYCAKFLTSVADSLVLAAGTVFNQVVLWSPGGRQNSKGRAAVFHRLTGHQGVIFSIDYDPVSRRICSVSDDRSIRLYQLRFPASDSVPTLEDWEKMETSLLHVLYGHSARVWDVKLLSTELVSVGEDSMCCVWSYQGEVLHKLKGHKGKSIWSMAVDKGENYVVTGGGDHSIRLWNLKKQSSDPQVTARALELKIAAADFPRNTQLLGFNRAVVITDNGKLLMIDCDTNKLFCLFSDDAFSSYTTMAVSAQTYTVAIGNIHGTLRIMHAQTLSAMDSGAWISNDIKICDGKVFSVLWLDDKSLLTTGPDGVVNLWMLKCDQSSVSVRMIESLELPPSKQRWVTAAAYVSDGSHLVCGVRSGSVLLYQLEGQQGGTLVHTFPKIHGKGGVTHICCHGDQVYSAGRDGRYRVYVLKENGDMALLNTNRVCKGLEWLETLVFTEDGDLHIHGFYTNMFVVWSVKHNQKILEVECGGGHRAWSYSYHDNTARLVYVKAREVMLNDVAMRKNQTIVKGSLHGRELCDVKHIASIHSHTGSCSDMIASCSEDTTICLSVLHYANGLPRLSVLHTLTGHISNVRCLAICPSSITCHGSSVNKLIFSAGGRAQIKVWRVRVNDAADKSSEAGGKSSEAGGKSSDAADKSSDAGGRSSDAGGKSSGAGDKSSEAGDKSSDAGGRSSEAGGKSSEAGGKSSDAGGKSSEAGGKSSETGDKSSEAGGKFSEAGGKSSQAGGKSSQAGDGTRIAVDGSGCASTEARKPGCCKKSTNSDNVLEMCPTSTETVPCQLQRGTEGEDCNVNKQCCEEEHHSDGNCYQSENTISCTDACDANSPSSKLNNCGCKKSTGIETNPVLSIHDCEGTQMKGCKKSTGIETNPVLSIRDCEGTQMKGCYNARSDSGDDAYKLADNTCVECLAGLQLGQNGWRRRKPWRQPVDNSDPETRILDLSVFSACELDQSMSRSLFFLSAACSDGLVRFFAFEEDSRELTLLTAAPYHDHCVLKTCHMIIPHDDVAGTSEESGHGISKNRAVILSAATDGVVAFWDMSVICESYMGVEDETTGAKDGDETRQGLKWEMRPFHALTIHQSGINSVHVERIADSRYMLVTGGDDNAVHVTIISMTTEVGKVTVKVVSKGGQTSAHAAQITGAWCVSPQLIITASIDQRVALWTISEVDSDIQVDMADCKFVNVSDVANIHAWKRGLTWYIMVCGEGLELLQLDVPPHPQSGGHVDSIVSETRLIS